VTEALDTLWTNYTNLKKAHGTSGDNSGKASFEIFNGLVTQGQKYMDICSVVNQELSELYSGTVRKGEGASMTGESMVNDGTMSKVSMKAAAMDKADEVINPDGTTADRKQSAARSPADREEVSKDVENVASLPDCTQAE